MEALKKRIEELENKQWELESGLSDIQQYISTKEVAAIKRAHMRVLDESGAEYSEQNFAYLLKYVFGVPRSTPPRTGHNYKDYLDKLIAKCLADIKDCESTPQDAAATGAGGPVPPS